MKIILSPLAAWYTGWVTTVLVLRAYKWGDIVFDLLGFGVAAGFVAVFRFAGHTAFRNIVGLPVIVAVALFLLFRVVIRVHARILIVRS